MKWLLFLTVYAAIVVTGLVIDLSTEKGRYDSDQIAVLREQNNMLTAVVEYREEIEYKKIELDYLFPIHICDWIPGPSALTSPFGERDDSEAGGFSDDWHEGTDMWAVSHVGPTWKARVVAISDGWAEHWINHSIKGRYIVVHHSDGNRSEYHHLSKSYIRDGDRVVKGQVLGRIGTTGLSTGVHLHFELWIDGKNVNPLKFLAIPTE